MTPPWMAAFGLLTAMVLLLAFLVLGLVRRMTVVLEGAESWLRSHHDSALLLGIPKGNRLPSFEALQADGAVVSSTLFAGEPFILLLLTSGCDPCRALATQLPALVAWEIPLVAVIDDTPEGRALTLPNNVRVLFQQGSRASDALRINTYPFAFALDAQMTVIDSDTASLEVLSRFIEALRAIVGAGISEGTEIGVPS